MPIRFHRQFTLFPGVKVNVSKTGMSITLGGKGFHLNLSKRGVMQTTNLPGKGLSHRSYILKNEGDNESKEDDEEEKRSSSEGKAKRRKRTDTKAQTSSSPWGFFLFLIVALFFIYFGGQAFGLLPPNLLTDLLSTLTQWAQQVGL
jgi:hypothetical protein